jgi:hypothetical protein
MTWADGDRNRSKVTRRGRCLPRESECVGRSRGDSFHGANAQVRRLVDKGWHPANTLTIHGPSIL